MVEVSRKKYYNNSLWYMVHCSSYENTAFSTQISLELLTVRPKARRPSRSPMVCFNALLLHMSHRTRCGAP